ncbi:hypothetical protein ACQR1Y_25280 [Bradyrhizobium sp. HKCCYLRH3099]|uniref:hypothetical protein n=1 Tax=unclassified Bradyrhizobium TaxID=2631580 RepID=UPI003EBA54C5
MLKTRKPLVGMAGIHSGRRIQQKTQPQRQLTAAGDHIWRNSAASAPMTRDVVRAVIFTRQIFPNHVVEIIVFFDAVSCRVPRFRKLPKIFYDSVRLIARFHPL